MERSIPGRTKTRREQAKAFTRLPYLRFTGRRAGKADESAKVDQAIRGVREAKILRSQRGVEASKNSKVTPPMDPHRRVLVYLDRYELGAPVAKDFADIIVEEVADGERSKSQLAALLTPAQRRRVRKSVNRAKAA